MASDDRDWVPDPKEVEYLSAFGTEQRAILAIGYETGVPAWKIGKAAGFSAGRITDEAKRRSNWAAAASRAAKRNRKLLPEIVALQEQLRRFREDGGEPLTVSWAQKKARLEHWIMHGGPQESIRATIEHNKMADAEGGNGHSMPSTVIVGELVRRGGKEKTRELLEVFAPNLLHLVDAYNAATHDAELVEALSRSYDDDDIDAIA